MKYRKKPVTIDAYQTDVELDIPTLEGTMHASVGDYIITGVRGEQYPCKPDIFRETYEPAQDDDGVVSAFRWRLMADGWPQKGKNNYIIMGIKGGLYLAPRFEGYGDTEDTVWFRDTRGNHHHPSQVLAWAEIPALEVTR